MLFELTILGQYTPRADRHRLAGTVTIDGSPAKRLVVVLKRDDLSYVAAKFSDQTTGAWEIKGLLEYPEKSLLVVAMDNSETYNAEVADYVSQVTGEGV